MLKKKLISRIRDKKEKLVDKKGYLSKTVAMKILEKYANEIDMVLTKYNKKSCNQTMMVKGLRKSCQDTTNRKIHQEDLELVVAQMAKGLKLSERIGKIMGKHHDIRHTFLGHSGEWWISNILEDYGLGCFCHNTLGASDLIFTDRVYDEIIEKIKAHNPGVKDKELKRVRKSLWLIMDAINAHNGEKPDKEFIPNSCKKEQDFMNEMISCYSVRGYDRKIMPATPEGCLMRLADKIAYTPLDMVDGIREGMVRDENGNIINYIDSEYEAVLTKLGITQEEINLANIKKDYTAIAEKIKERFINDVVQNSTKKKIRMSKENMVLMGELLNLNNKKAVDNVVLTEDQKTYPPAIRELMNRFKDIILDNNLMERLPNAKEDRIINNELEEYRGTPYEPFIQYICKMNADDFNFIVQVAEKATKEGIKAELEIARKCVEERKQYEDKEELGLDYSAKNARIKAYITYYEKQLQDGKLMGYGNKNLEQEVEKIFGNIESGKKNPNYLNMEQRIAMLIGTRYIATLNDIEFIELLQDTELINEEQYKSLTRKYKDIPDLKSEVYIQSDWKGITALQEKATQEQKEEL